ncbi:MAG: 2-hydroxyglutaryl-CoA dehydratase [Deltaproteobacteria bacterium]|nr:2-hydroxyglutaryl-CoA dehydratase [Deltaproteobacteria bacterium]
MKNERTFFAGIDIGSMTTKCVVIDQDDFFDSTILMTDADPKSAGTYALESLLDKNRIDRTNVSYILGTGYGRISLDFFDHTATELTCHARGVRYVNPDVEGIIDIGGQDSKAIKLKHDGSILDFVLNDRCAAGTGRFLEVMARALKVEMEEFGELYKKSKNPCPINSTCIVFAESEVISLSAQGESKTDIAAGLHHSIAKRVGNMAKRLGIRENAAFVGGVAKNTGMRSALEDYMGIKFVSFSTDPQITGALGAAVIAREQFLKKQAE